ncbi:MAG: sigma-70 family RNA polymerase sigma factor [Planctomycetes bacterium]|nr:sigma-70 family RNA polymerase sigma factor [Planctomycetota bacterium]
MTADRPPRSESSFLTTRWSVVQRASGAASEVRQAALEDLARTYWYPLYAFARRRGLAPDVAADRVQACFALLLERDDFARADPARGRFRAFLLTAFRHVLIDSRERERAQKRGGDRAALSIDALAAEGRLLAHPVDADTPEAAFERAWVAELLARSLARLGEEQARIGRMELFAKLRPHLSGEDDGPRFASIAGELGLTENAVKVAAHRLRKRYGELLRDEVAATLGDPNDAAAIEDEVRALFRTFERRV